MNLISIIALICIIGIVVFVHEFGHFLLAKKNGIGVIQFAIGMGPDIIKWVKNDTRYCIKCIPFGGSCIMMDQEAAMYGIEDIEIDEEKSFQNKSVWSRISVIAAGPIFNFLLAFLLAVIVITYAGSDICRLIDVPEGRPAQEAGLQTGDEIVKINGTSIHLYRELLIYLSMNPGKELDMVYMRDGQTMQTHVVPQKDETGAYKIGVVGGVRYSLNVPDIFRYSFYEVKYNIVTTVKSLGKIFTGGITINDFSGPVGIATMVDDIVDEVQTETQNDPFSERAMTMFLTLANFMILISANLGVMNLLPIPALDGGRLLFLLIEAVRGKPVSREKEGIVQVAGFIFLMAFMVIILFNDVRKIFM
ncbi:MAG: RIP metalloprotease RseP [Candidatus Fimimorpha sp.]